jgi:hypothetical protein
MIRSREGPNERLKMTIVACQPKESLVQSRSRNRMTLTTEPGLKLGQRIV